MKKLLASAALAATMAAGTAAADTVPGTVINTTGDAGSAHIVRAGVIAPLAIGDTLQAGDRLVTREGASVDLQFDGCSATLAEASTVVLGAEFCAQVAEAASGEAFETASTTANDAELFGLGPVVTVLGLAAVGGAIAGIVVAATDDDTDEPVSP